MKLVQDEKKVGGRCYKLSQDKMLVYIYIYKMKSFKRIKKTNLINVVVTAFKT